MHLFGNLHLICDSEYGTHVIYNYLSDVIDFFTDSENIEEILEELNDYINTYIKGNK